MEDITGRTIKIGDILAVGQRAGNSGALDIRIVIGFKVYETWNGKTREKIKTTSGGYLIDPTKILIINKTIFAGTKMEAEIEEQLKKVK